MHASICDVVAPGDGRFLLRVTINGTQHQLTVSTDRLLIDVLRDDLGLTGTKKGCSVGVCGVCGVLVDGELMSACLLLALAVHERSVTTVEGLAAADGTLSPLQAAFVTNGGLQCGICTPGQLVAATALLNQSPNPDESEIREWMAATLCRCTGYGGIIASIRAASAASRGTSRTEAARAAGQPGARQAPGGAQPATAVEPAPPGRSPSDV